MWENLDSEIGMVLAYVEVDGQLTFALSVQYAGVINLIGAGSDAMKKVSGSNPSTRG